MAEIRWNHTLLSSITIGKIRSIALTENGLSAKIEVKKEERKMIIKFKVGDMVIGNDKADERYSTTKKGWIGRVVENSAWDRCDYIRVESLDSNNRYRVNPNYFDLYITHEGKILIMVDEKDPNKIVARDLITKKTAEAKCNPKDEWDFSKGAKLALERLYPEKKEEEKPKYWSGKVVCVKADDGFMWHKRPCFTVGKVYEVKDGHLYDNAPTVPFMNRIVSVDQLNSKIDYRYNFIEFKGEA